MKKALKLLEELSSPYKEQAKKNFNEAFFNNNSAREFPLRGAGDALRCAFAWEESEQGYEYWWDLHEKLVTK